MWNVASLITVVLVGASHQRASDFSSMENGSRVDAVNSTTYADRVDGQRNVTVEYGELTVAPGPFAVSRACPPCSCGALGRKGKIVGGTVARVNQYPWMAMLLSKGKFYCGASLINSKYVLTAAHCVTPFKKEDISVRLLEHDLSNNKDAKRIDFRVLNVIKHKRYNRISKDNDIALLRMDTEGVEFGSDSGINPVCLPPKGNSFVGYKAVVTGWGRKAYRGPTSDVLRQARLPIMKNEDCGKTNNGREVTSNMLCAGYLEGGEDACQGDSGGPLQVKIKSAFYIAGIVSWGKGCAMANQPGVYTRVNKYLDWINNNTKNACACSSPNLQLENDV